MGTAPAPSPPSPGPQKPPTPLDGQCKAEIAKQCGSVAGNPSGCQQCADNHAKDFISHCPQGSTKPEAVAECFVSGSATCRAEINTACSSAFGNEVQCTQCIHGAAKALISACGNDESGGRTTIEYCLSQPSSE